MNITQSDIVRRTKAALPGRWFNESTPVLDIVLGALATGWVELFGFLDYTNAQTRVASAVDIWLDLAGSDYFGRRLRRRPRENDTSLRARIIQELRRDRCTRAALHQLLVDLTGAAPVIFEPSSTNDTGCYGSLSSTVPGAAGFGCGGGWGNLDLPFQLFVKVFRPVNHGIAMVNGWSGGLGAYGAGSSAYIDASADSAEVDDGEIYTDICRIVPAGTVVWVTIQS